MRRALPLPLVLALGAFAGYADSAVPPTALDAPHSISASSAAPTRTRIVDPVLFFVRGSDDPHSAMSSVNGALGAQVWTKAQGYFDGTAR